MLQVRKVILKKKISSTLPRLTLLLSSHVSSLSKFQILFLLPFPHFAENTCQQVLSDEMGAGKSYSAQTLPYLTSSLQKPLEEILFVSLL